MRTNFNRPLKRITAAVVATLGLAAVASLAPTASVSIDKHSPPVAAAPVHPKHLQRPAAVAQCEVEDSSSPFRVTTVWQPHLIDGSPWQTVAAANPGIRDLRKIYAMDMASLRRSSIPVEKATELPKTQILQVPVVVGRHALREVDCTPAEAATNHILRAVASAVTENTLEAANYYASPENDGSTDMVGTAWFDTAFYSLSASLETVHGIPDATGTESANSEVQGIASNGEWTTLESITVYPSEGVSDQMDDTTLVALGGQAPFRPIDTSAATSGDVALLNTAKAFVDDTIAYTSGK